MARKRTGTIRPRGPNSWQIRYVNNDGIRQSETVSGDRNHAESELASRLVDVSKGLPVSSKPNTVLFGELADDVLTDYEVNKFKSIDDIEARFRLHIVPVFGRRRAATITTAQIRHYTLRRQQAGASAGTINRELEAIRHTFNLALKGQKLLHAPHVPRLRENNVRTGFFSREEVERLCRHLSEPLASFVKFGFLTGWRVSEIRALQWRQIDFTVGEIRLDVGSDKNRSGRVFPMSVELRDLLKALTKARKAAVPANKRRVEVKAAPVAAFEQYVFAIDGKPIGEFRKTWLSACHKAGLPCVYSKETKKPVKALRTFHDLRRSFAREMSNRGIREGAIMKLGGWKTRSVFDRYNIVSDADLRDAIEQVDGAKRDGNRAKRGTGPRRTQ